MKKPKILTILFILISVIAGVIIGGYFLINLVLLPQIAIPQIEKQINKSLDQKIFIKNIHISPQGIIKIKKIVLNQKQGSQAFVQADLITLIPDYKQIFNSWKKDKNKFNIALNAKINNAQVNQTPVIIKLNAQADILVNLDLKQPENLNYTAQINLDNMLISKIPTVGQINDINGTISISKDKATSSDIQGKINDAIAKLDFKIEDFTNPKVELNCELSPLILKLKCSLEQNTLLISQMNAEYNQIRLDVNGKIDNIKENPLAQINSQISIQLDDLTQLPLEIKPALEKLKPRGLVSADINIQGPLKNIPRLAGTIAIKSKQISILDYVIKNLRTQADIENGKINISEFAVNFLDMDLKTTGSVDLLSKSLDYNFQINIFDLALGKLKNILAKQAKFYNYLSGVINANLTIKGRALDFDLITLEANATADNLVYDQIVLPKRIELDTDLSIRNMSNIVLRKAILNDMNTQLTVNGNIENIFLNPKAELSGQIKTDLEKLKNYSMLKLPAESALSGKPIIDFKLNGLLKKPNTLDINFNINTAAIRYNQFEIDDLKAKGTFKNNQLNIASLLAELYSGQLEASANADLNKMQNPIFELNANLEGFDMQSFALGTKLIQTDFQGSLDVKINVSGSGAKPNNLDINSKLDLELNNIKVNNIAIEKANAQINADYKNNSIRLKDSSLRYKDIQAKAKGTISSLSNKPQINLDINSKINLDDLNKLPIPQEIKKQLDALKLKGYVSARINIDTPLSDFTAMDLTADISSDQIEIKKIKLTDINLNANMRDKLLNATAKLNAYEGTADLVAAADFNQPEFSYTAKANIDKLNFGELIKESKIVSQQHKGIASLTADLKGMGKDFKTIIGNANLKLNDTLIANMGMLKLFANIFKADFLVNFEITEGNADIVFENSKATLQNTSFTGPDAVILARGAILLDNLGFENFWATLQLTDSGAQKINQNFLRNVFDFNGTVYQKEIEVKGTISAPIIDQKKLLGGLVANTLLNQVFKNSQPENSGQPKSDKDAKMELFKSVLNGLFK